MLLCGCAGVVEAINLYSYRDGPRIWDVTNSWTENATHPWNGPGVTNIPGASDDVYITHSMTVTNDAESLTLTTGYKGTWPLTIATNGTLTADSMTLSVSSGKNSTINNAGTITLSGDFRHSRAIATVDNSGTMNIGGDLKFASHATAAEEMYFTNSGTIVVSGEIANGAYTNWTFHMLDGTVTASNLYMNGSVTAHIDLNG